MHIIRIGTTEYSGPSAWSELTATNLIYLGRIFSLPVQNEITTYYTIAKLFGVPLKLFLKLKPFQKIQLQPLLSWLMKKNSLNKWLIKCVRAGTVLLYGPADQLADMTAEEFMYCEGVYERWEQTEDATCLDTLFAILYRKKAFFTGERAVFRAEKLKKAEARTKRVKPWLKRAIAINYAGCRNLIIERHPNIWRTATEEMPGAAGKPFGYTNWVSIILDMSGGKFGDYEKTLKTNIWLVLAELEKQQRA
jgi:hypothetical protein